MFYDGSDQENEEPLSTAIYSHLLHLRWSRPDSFVGTTLNDNLSTDASTQKAKNFVAAHHEFCSLLSPQWWCADGGVYFDLQGMERLHGPWIDGAIKICQKARSEFPIWSAGLASSPLAAKLVSWVAAQWGRQQLWAIPHSMVSAFLAGFPLRLFSDEYPEVPRLGTLGVRTLGDLQVLPESLMSAVFGPHGKDLALAAKGIHFPKIKPNHSRKTTILVAQVSFTSPLTSQMGERALQQALALRAIAWRPNSTDDSFTPMGRWFLSIRWSSGSQPTTGELGSGWDTLESWLLAFEVFWRKIRFHRKGIYRVDLHFETLAGHAHRQMDLFDGVSGERKLARTIGRIRREKDPYFASASEILLQGWGAQWTTP